MGGGRVFMAFLVLTACAGAATVLGIAQLVESGKASRQAQPSAQQIALRFIATAVERQHPERAEALVSRELRQGTTHTDWTTGFIPVVPFLSHPARVHLRELARTRRMVRLLVGLRGREDKGTFLLELRRGAHGPWLVSYWGPAMMVAAPRAAG